MCGFLPLSPHQATARIIDIFEVEPNKMCIASRSHAFATVTFTPQTMQSYQCIFEATLDGVSRYQHPSNLSCKQGCRPHPMRCHSCHARLTGLHLPVPLQHPDQEPKPRV